MIEFILALLVFLGAHSIPARPAIRARLVGALGERAYLLIYSLLSLGLLAWLISAAVRAPTIQLWPTTVGSYHLALVLMLPASWLLVGGSRSLRTSILRSLIGLTAVSQLIAYELADDVDVLRGAMVERV